jgi:acetyl esterase/lipase
MMARRRTLKMSTRPQLTRRTMLAALGTAGLAACGTGSGTSHNGSVETDQLARPPAPVRHAYGSDPSQWAELHLPVTGAPSRGTAIVIHGGFWRSQYGADLGTPLAIDLASKGWLAWNLEYRRVGNGGGWPNTLADVAAGIDLLATLNTGLDPKKIVAIGHSAGGQLATWAAHRAKLPAGVPGAHPKLNVTAVISQAGVLDLSTAALNQVGGTAVPDLLGGLPGQVPDRYRDASPQVQLPLAVPVHCVHDTDDEDVPFSQSVNYVNAAKRAGADAELVQVTGGHMSLIDTTAPAWQAVLEILAKLF